MNRPYEIYADCPTAYLPVELFDLKKGHEYKYNITSSAIVDTLKETMLDVKSWLPFCAEPYAISSNIEDYVAIPVIIMPSELPNRNGVGFPYDELTRFNTDTGTLAYQTWKGKPTHIEHQNKILDAAKGVIFATAMRPLKGTNIWRVIVLCGFDRKKDPSLVNDILTGERSSYSMGAFVKDYECSICSARLSNGGCNHVESPGKPPKFNIYEDNKLAYYRAIDPLGFETSSVAVPAYTSATNSQYIKMFKD